CHVRQLALEFRDRRCVLSLHRHVDQDLEAEADRRRIDDGSVSADRSALFQCAQASVARSDAQPDPVSERGYGEAALGFELSNDLSVDGVQAEDPYRFRAVRARIWKKEAVPPAYLFDESTSCSMKAGERSWVTSSPTHRSPPRRSRSRNSCPSSS